MEIMSQSEYITATPLMNRITQLYPMQISKGYNVKVYFHSDSIKLAKKRQYLLVIPDSFAFEHNDTNEFVFEMPEIKYIQIANTIITERGNYFIYIINTPMCRKAKCFSYKVFKQDSHENVRTNGKFPTLYTPNQLIQKVQEDYPETKNCYDMAFHFKLDPNNKTFALLTLIYKDKDMKPHTILKGNVPYALKFTKEQFNKYILNGDLKYHALVIRNTIISFNKPGFNKPIEYHPIEIRSVSSEMEQILETMPLVN